MLDHAPIPCILEDAAPPAPHKPGGGAEGPDPQTDASGLSEADLGTLAEVEGPALRERTRGSGRGAARERGGTLGPLAVGAEVRDAVADLFPGDDGVHARLALHSALASDVHKSTDRSGFTYMRVKVGGHVLAEIVGDLKGYANKKFGGLLVLDAHKTWLPGFVYTRYKRGEYPRQVRDHGLPTALLDALEADLLLPFYAVAEPVWAWDGAAFANPGTGDAFMDAKARREALIARVEAGLDPETDPSPQSRLIQFLNDQKTNVTSRLVRRNAESAIAATVGAYPDRDRRLRALAEVRRVSVSPHVAYGPSGRGRSLRAFPRCTGVATLPKAARRALFAGAVELDLANAQLAVVAARLEVGPVLDLLDREGTAWPHLFRAAGWPNPEPGPERDRVKRALKGALYAIVFGMSEHRVSWTLRRDLGADAVDGLLSDPVVRALLVDRDAELARIERAGGTVDCFGRWYPVESRDAKERASQARSAMACAAQADELRLLEPVVDTAIEEQGKKRPAFQILAWQHDGLTISIGDRRDRDRIVGRLSDLVAARASEMGVPTVLERTDL